MKPRKSVSHAVDIHVGARVRARRTQLGMSQSALGDALGISFQQIQKYEKGTNRISSSRLHQMAKILKVAPPYFFEDPLAAVAANHEKSDASTFDQFCASRDGIALMQAFLKLDKAKQYSIAMLVDELAQ